MTKQNRMGRRARDTTALNYNNYEKSQPVVGLSREIDEG